MPETIRVTCAAGCGTTQAMAPEWTEDTARWWCQTCNAKRDNQNTICAVCKTPITDVGSRTVTGKPAHRACL